MRPGAILLMALPVLAQDDFRRVEVTAGAWQASLSGTLQAGGLPANLHSDLRLQDRTTFFGRLAVKAGRRHRFLVEGSPYRFEGTNTISRTLTYAGQTFNFQETIASKADLTYVFGGYQFDLVSAPRGHFGLEAGGAFLDATGSISARGITASKNQTIGLPLAGADFRFWPLRFLYFGGGLKGMALGGYGHFVMGEVNGGIGFKAISFEGGYRVLDADIHENSADPLRAGIAPRIQGPAFSVQFRY